MGDKGIANVILNSLPSNVFVQGYRVKASETLRCGN